MRRALVVGIDNYPSAPLSGCVNDANRVAALLAKNGDGSPNFDVRTLTGPPADITRPALRKAIDELFRDAADVALFYFSGHGTENDLGGFIVTRDVTSYDEGVALTDVLTWANRSAAKQVVIALDSCHSGALGNVPVVSNDGAVIREGVSILTASRATQVAIETHGMGLFTSLFCGALEGGAADVLGNVTAAAVYAYVDQSLGAWGQRPLFKAHVSTLTPLRHTRAAVILDVLRRLPAWFPTGDAEYGLAPSYEPTHESADPDHVEIFRCLQKCRDAKLVEPVGEDHMYYAALNGKSCRLTELGKHYRHLAELGRI
jgi:uncharacterized caspase-like protein